MGHADVKGNKMADHLAGSVTVTNSLSMDKHNKSVPCKLQDQEDMDLEGSTHHSCLLEWEVMKTSARQLSLGGKDKQEITSVPSSSKKR